MREMRKCEECGAKRWDVSQDRKDDKWLCPRCFQYRLLQEGVEEGDRNAETMMDMLQFYYPDNVEGQKNMLMAIFELIDAGKPTMHAGKETVMVDFDKAFTIAERWNVTETFLIEMARALLAKTLDMAG